MIGIPNEKPTIKSYVSSNVKFYTTEDMQRLTGWSEKTIQNCLMTQAFLLLITEERKSSRHTH